MATTRNTNLLSNAYNKQGYNPGFTDIFTATTKGMGSVNQKQPKNNTYEDRVIDSEIKNFNQAIDFNYGLVPPELLNQVTSHLNYMSKERGNLGLISSQMDSSDLTKIDLDQNRDMIDSGVVKLGDQFATVKGHKNEYTEFEHDYIVRGDVYRKIGTFNKSKYEE